MARHNLSNRPGEYLDYTLSLPAETARPPALVTYVHGFASDQAGEKTRYFAERFLEIGCAYLAFDHRGHGKSSGTMAGLTVPRNIEDLEALLNTVAKPFSKRILIGSSMGGHTAAWVAARHPERIDANLLIAPAFRFVENRVRDIGPEGIETLRREGEITVRNQWIEVRIGKQILEDVDRYSMEALISRFKTPALILHGTADDAVAYEDSVAFSERSTARPLELLLIAGGDHRLTDQKETLFLEMRSFLERNKLLI